MEDIVGKKILIHGYNIMVKYIDVGQRDLFYKKRMIITLLLIIGHW